MRMLKLVIIAGLQLERSKGGLGTLGCFVFFWLDSGKFPMCLEMVWSNLEFSNSPALACGGLGFLVRTMDSFVLFLQLVSLASEV